MVYAGYKAFNGYIFTQSDADLYNREIERCNKYPTELNLDNKMTSHWESERFQYLAMLSWLYCHRRPAVGNALKSYYKDENDHHLINPEFSVLKQFTSDEDAYKIYVEYTNHK